MVGNAGYRLEMKRLSSLLTTRPDLCCKITFGKFVPITCSTSLWKMDLNCSKDPQSAELRTRGRSEKEADFSREFSND